MSKHKYKITPPEKEDSHDFLDPEVAALEYNIEWSKQSYNLEQLVKENKFPVIVKVTSGYCSDTLMETVSSGEVFRIQACGTQKRVMAKGSKGSYYSVPITHPLLFQPLGKEANENQLIKTLIEKYTLPLQVILRPPSGYYALITEELTLESVYSETFSLANSIINGSLHPTVVVFPCYLCLEVVIGEGLRSGNTKAWTESVARLDDIAHGLDYESVLNMADINVYSASKVGRTSSVYEQVEPDTYITHADLRRQKQVDPPEDNFKEDSEEDKPDPPTPPVTETIAKMNLSLNCNRKPAVYPRRRDVKETPPQDISAQDLAPHAKHNIYEVIPHAQPGQQTVVVKPSKPPYPVVHPRQGGAQEAAQNKIHTPKHPPQDRPNRNEDVEPANAQPSQQCLEVKPMVPLPPEKGSKGCNPITSFDEIPADISKLSCLQISDCLRLLNMEKYVERFLEDQVDGSLLIALEEDMLINEFKLDPFKARKLHRFATLGWRPSLQR